LLATKQQFRLPLVSNGIIKHQMQFELQRSSRSHSISIQLEEPERVIVRAHPLIPEFLINQFVQSKEAWILRNLAKLRRRRSSLAKNQVSLFGKLYQIHANFSANTVGIFAKNQEVLIQNLSQKTQGQLEKQLERFLKNTAEKYIRQRAEQVAKKMQIDFHGLTLRQQKSRWGSCSSRGNLNFNWRLVHYPPAIIDYVIIHELAHRREMNHSAAFWRLVGQYDPEYKQHRQELAKKRYNEHYDFDLPRR
jgi:predicted metal-dependent hydrolase